MEHQVGLSEIEADLLGFITDDLLAGEGGDLTVDTPLLELGVLDSVTVQQVFMFVEDRYGVVLDDGKVPPSNFATIRRMGETIQHMKPLR